MIISQDPEEISNALSLQLHCELKRIALRHCHASIEGSEETGKPPFSLRFSHNSTANAITEGLLRIEVRFNIQSYDGSEPPVLLFGVECSFDADYEIEEKSFQPSEESIAAFKDGNAVFNCWPYARELVQNITSRMELHPPPIPLLRFIAKHPQPTSPPAEKKRRTHTNKASKAD